MRPLKLSMSAFGPYAATQTVDFREATDAGLFGIYGPTGSGKSSIFSAMTFALFGEAAKKEQPMTTLRSAHADADLLTEVSFVFELGAKRYLIKRQPEQMRPKARGDGETGHSHAAWLFDVTNVDLDTIDLDGCGTILAEKKVGLVATQLTEILGYGAEQFRQIVLLPQGRFEKFLTADSNERLAILRELFDVSLYRSISERLKQQASEAKRAVQDGYRVHGQRLQAEGFESSDALEDGIAEAAEAAEEARRESAVKDTAESEANTAHRNAEAVEAQFAAAEKAQKDLNELQSQEADIEQKRVRAANAARAQRATDKATAIQDAEKQLQNASEAEKQAYAANEEAQDSCDAAERNLKAERDRSGELEALQRTEGDLGRYSQALAEAEDLKAELEEAETARLAATTHRDEAQDALQELTKVVANQENAIAEAQQAEASRLRLEAQKAAVQGKLDKATAYEKAASAAAVAESKLQDTRARLDLATLEKERVEAEAKEAEQAYFSAQAGILAHHLGEGEPCPVCGSEEHPMLATAEGDVASLKRDFDAAREDLAEAIDAHQTAKVAYSTAKNSFDEKSETLAQIEDPQGTAEAIRDELTQIEESIDALGEPRDIEALQQTLAEVKRDLGEAEKALEGAKAKFQTAMTAEAVAKRSYEDQIDDVPEKYRNPSDLEAAIGETVRKIAARKKAFDDADEQAKRARTDAASASANLTSAKKAKEGAGNAVERAREQFTARLSELDLSKEQYDEFVGDVPEIDELKAEVDAFEAGLREAKGAARQAQTAIKDATRPDLAALLTAQEDAQQASAAARAVWATKKARVETLENLKAELARELARLQKLEEETGPLRLLADAFSGQNEMNTTLESFAIGAMFDQVLEAANLRLEPMTSGRYRLERDVESTGGRAKRGLDIRVHDIETGRPRNLTTLSGGETFIAALALALGLSDIVEASHGAIRLDTIFIDEGFGSLDTENDSGTLDRVLQVLQDIVGASRSVGLISHVPLVQQAVPVGFTIQKGVGGSSIEKRAA